MLTNLPLALASISTCLQLSRQRRLIYCTTRHEQDASSFAECRDENAGVRQRAICSDLERLRGSAHIQGEQRMSLQGVLAVQL